VRRFGCGLPLPDAFPNKASLDATRAKHAQQLQISLSFKLHKMHPLQYNRYRLPISLTSSLVGE
jgi:hypothetical protein